ncbi:MAG TPA: YceI family protein [Nakamurella sp.]
MTSSAVAPEALDVTPAGTFEVDPAHSRLGFAIRHMMTPVHGQFLRFSGNGVLAGSDLAGSSVVVTIEAASIETHQPDRDAHLRTADFFDVDAHPTITLASTSVRRLGGDRVVVAGDLTIKGITRLVELEFTYHGAGTDPYGQLRLGFTGTGKVSRRDWGLTWNVALETGGMVLGDTITLEIEVTALVTSSTPELKGEETP